MALQVTRTLLSFFLLPVLIDLVVNYTVMDTFYKSESQENSCSLAIKELVNGFRFGGGMQSVSPLAQSFCRSITHTAEQDPNQNTAWFELLS